MSDEVKERLGNVIVFGDVKASIEREQMDDEFSISYAKTDQGNILRIGGSIYFLKFWKDDHVRQGYEIIQQALSAELLDRGYEISVTNV